METSAPARLSVRTPSGWVPLGFVREADRVFLVARERSANWPVSMLRAGEAVLRLPEATRTGTPHLVTAASERAEILAKFRAAYGPELYSRWYERPARVLTVDLAGTVTPGDAAHRYERWLEAEFDNVAEEYDRHILGNRMNRLLRDRSLAQLRTTFQPYRTLLEIGCGSGIETLAMLREGHEVVAVDVSRQMLEVVRRKAREDGSSERLRTVHLRAAELATLTSDGGLPPVDAAYSTYGAMNCEPDLGPTARALAQLLPVGAPLLLGVYNRWCAFELVGYGLSLRPGRALGRRTNPVLVGSSRFCVDVFAYAPRDIERWFGPYFRRVRLEGVPVVLPPSDLASYADRFSREFDLLATLDARIGARFPWNHLGDHFLATFRRRDSVGPVDAS